MLLNYTNKKVKKNEIFNCDELNNFLKNVFDKYSPNIVQNNCPIIKKENEENYIFEFIINQKYGSEMIDLIYEPIILFNQINKLS